MWRGLKYEQCNTVEEYRNGSLLYGHELTKHNIYDQINYSNISRVSSMSVRYNDSVIPTDCCHICDAIEWPYAIGAMSELVSAILFLCLSCNIITQPEILVIHQPAKSLKAACDLNTCSPSRPLLGLMLVSAFFFYYACLNSTVTILNTFLFT